MSPLPGIPPRLPVAAAAEHPLRAVLWVLLLIVVIWQLPYGQAILYPLSLLATCAHELGHGFAALLVGAEFHSFVLHADGTGMATWQGSPGRLATALVATGGLLGPSIAGSLLLILARSTRQSRLLLWLVAGSLLVVVVWWTRNPFGVIFLLACAVFFAVAALWLNDRSAAFVARLTGAVLCLSWFQHLDYMFSASASVGGVDHPSDTAVIARVLWLPYWFWGGVIATMSLAVLTLGLWIATRPRSSG
jgi:hypothetical protein